MSRAVGMLALAALPLLVLAGCETTQQKSARLAKSAKKVVQEKGLTVAKVNPDVTVTGTTVLRDANGVAAVVELRNRTAKAEQNVPIAIDVLGAGGKSVFRNDLPGLAASLVSVPLLEPHQAGVWVHDQIRADGTPKAVKVRVGFPPAAGATAAATAPKIVLSKVRLRDQIGGISAEGVVENESKVAQKNLTVFCVARRAGKIVAAGRAIVPLLKPAPTPKPTTFTVFFIGNPRGGQLQLFAPPTTLS